MQILFKGKQSQQSCHGYEKVDQGGMGAHRIFFGGVVAADSLGKCRRLKGNLDKSLIRLNFFAILSWGMRV